MGERNADKIGTEVYNLARTMTTFGVTLDEAFEELRLAYAEALEEMARWAREKKLTS